MPERNAPIEPFDPQLEQALERRIVQRTWGRVHLLHVAALSDRLVVHGVCPTYHVKQLAAEAIRECMGSVPVELDIEVCGGDSPLMRRDGCHPE